MFIHLNIIYLCIQSSQLLCFVIDKFGVMMINNDCNYNVNKENAALGFYKNDKTLNFNMKVHALFVKHKREF